MRVFVTGASGWIGSAVVPELISAGHHVTGLARSDASAAALAAAGAGVVRGTLDDLDVLRSAAAASDAVVHLAFKHDVAFAGDFDAAAAADRRSVEAFGEVLAGSNTPLTIASGVIGIAPGGVGTEHDDADTSFGGGPAERQRTARFARDLASRGVRSSVMRLPPTVHGAGDPGFMSRLIAIAREKGVSGYIGDGATRWSATHQRDAARAFRLAIEKAPAGATLHAIAEEGVPARTIAEAIGRHLRLPVASIDPQNVAEHFGWLGHFFGADCAASSTITRELLGWTPSEPALIADLDAGHYFV